MHLLELSFDQEYLQIAYAIIFWRANFPFSEPAFQEKYSTNCETQICFLENAFDEYDIKFENLCLKFCTCFCTITWINMYDFEGDIVWFYKDLYYKEF